LLRRQYFGRYSKSWNAAFVAILFNFLPFYVLAGTPMPYRLRDYSLDYTLVGERYVAGAMSGKASDVLEYSELESIALV
jgi:hypothetical protein